MEYIEDIEVNGRKYKLQHPGNREVLKIRTKCVNAQTGGVDLEGMLEYGFDNCIIPEGHDFHPNFDNIKPSEFEEWSGIIPAFFRGQSIDKYKAVKKPACESTEKSTAGVAVLATGNK